MKGLLIKDFKLLMLSKRILAFLALIALVFILKSGGTMPTQAAAYMISVVLVLSLSSISYDQFDNGLSFLLTLPVTRKTYVTEKYFFCALSGFAGLVFSLALRLLTGLFTGVFALSAEYLISILIIYAVLFLATADIFIPIQLKYSADGGRTVILLIAGILIAAFYLVSRLCAAAGIDLQAVAAAFAAFLASIPTAGLVLIGAAFFAVISAVSYRISLNILYNKQL